MIFTPHVGMKWTWYTRMCYLWYVFECVLAFSARPLLSHFCAWSNEVNNWMTISYVLPTMVVVSSSFESNIIVPLVICFELICIQLFLFLWHIHDNFLLMYLHLYFLGDGPMFDVRIHVCPRVFNKHFRCYIL